jgi:hypothetical protein
MPAADRPRFEGVARIAALHMMGTFEPSTWQGTPRPGSARHGLPEQVADEVLTLRLDDFESDLAALVPLLLLSAAAVTWPTEPPALPPAPPVNLSQSEAEELQQRDHDADRLTGLTPERIEQEGWTEQDLQPLRDAARRRRVAQVLPDAAAFYRPFSTLARDEAARETLSADPEWGVYLTTGGIETIARDVFAPAGLSDQEALRCATAFLLGHELGHLLTDAALADDDLLHGWGSGGKRTEALAAAHRAQHEGAACPAEEAFCESYALSFLGDALASLSMDATRAEAAKAAALEHVADGLPGYRDGAKILTARDRFTHLRDLLEHAGVTDFPDRAALLADLDRHVTPASAVPIHLVVTPGSAFADHGWWMGHTR